MIDGSNATLGLVFQSEMLLNKNVCIIKLQKVRIKCKQMTGGLNFGIRFDLNMK